MNESICNQGKDDRLPEWLIKEYNQSPPLSPDLLKRFGYIKKDFMEFLKPEGGAGRRFIEICYEITGNVISKIDSIIEGVGLVCQLEPLRCRGTDPSPKGGKPPRVLSQLMKESGAAILRITFLEIDADREIEIELLTKANKTRIRPFTVSVQDLEGNLIEEAVTVGTADNAPRFINPSAGFYCFVVEWENARETLTIEIR